VSVQGVATFTWAEAGSVIGKHSHPLDGLTIANLMRPSRGILKLAMACKKSAANRHSAWSIAPPPIYLTN
jgi:hypothetical protein